MGKYIKKGRPETPEVAPHLPIVDRINDLVIDMSDHFAKPSRPQLDRFAQLTAEAWRQAEQGLVVLASPWVAPRPVKRELWYGRNEATHPLPVVVPKTYRVSGCRVS